MKMDRDADFVHDETADWTREQLVNEIIRLHKVWRIDVSKLVKEKRELEEEVRKTHQAMTEMVNSGLAIPAPVTAEEALYYEANTCGPHGRAEYITGEKP
jgi:hypothetical protein